LPQGAMDIMKIVQDLQSSAEYRDWSRNNKKSYLVHAFKLLDEINKDMWQIGFYVPEHDRIVTFIINGGIQVCPEAEIFKENKKKILPLKLDKVKISFVSASERADKIRVKKFPKENPLKKFFILQHLKQGQLWNITYLTETYKTINIKLNADSGKVIECHIVNIIENIK
jgi:hypothetical protein